MIGRSWERPSLRRSVDLFRAFRVEQTDPDRFYGALAADSVALLRRWSTLDGATVLDIGGGPGYFADAFTRRRRAVRRCSSRMPAS